MSSEKGAIELSFDVAEADICELLILWTVGTVYGFDISADIFDHIDQTCVRGIEDSISLDEGIAISGVCVNDSLMYGGQGCELSLELVQLQLRLKRSIGGLRTEEGDELRKEINLIIIAALAD